MMRMHNRADFFTGHFQGSTFKKHNKQLQRILRNSYQCRSLNYTPHYESKIAKKFKRISQIQVQIWLSKNDNIQIYKNARMLQDLNPNVYASTFCMFVSGYFHLLGMRKTRKFIPCSKVGLDLWKWMRLKETGKMQTALTKNLEINYLQPKMLKQHWAPFFHLLGNISACWSPIYNKKGSCNRFTAGDMVRIKRWVCLATLMAPSL